MMANPSMVGLAYPATSEPEAKGFPPTLLTSGTRDLFLSNAVRMHWALRAHGIPAELFIDEAGSPGGFAGCPESEQVLREINRFLKERWGRTI
jgi:acetyl esterase/lipase